MPDTLRCLIVEDEPLAAEILEDYLREVPFLEHAGSCRDAIFAMDWLQRETIDVLLLDIHLPKLKGLDFAKSLRLPPQIILTTAYPQYALESYEIGVVDYLLKPIEFARFMQAVNRLERKSKHLKQEGKSLAGKEDVRYFSVNKRQQKVRLTDILYIEGMREYVKIHTTSGSLIVKQSLKDTAEELGADFVRIHKSFLVARQHVNSYSATDVCLSEQVLPIGRAYRQEVKKAWNTGRK